jgi:hypothetical protein
VLRRIWAKALTPWRDQDILHRNLALAQLLEQGSDQDLLTAAVRQAVFDAIWDVIMAIDDGYDPDA